MLLSLESPHQRFSLERVIASTHSKSTKPSGFNLILHEFYDMICEIIVSKTVREIFLIFCRSSFTNNFMVKNNFSEPKNHQKLYISRFMCFLNKIPARHFVGLICTNKLEYFFSKKISFQGLGTFFMNAKLLIWVSIFSTKINFMVFSSVII